MICSNGFRNLFVGPCPFSSSIADVLIMLWCLFLCKKVAVLSGVKEFTTMP